MAKIRKSVSPLDSSQRVFEFVLSYLVGVGHTLQGGEYTRGWYLERGVSDPDLRRFRLRLFHMVYLATKAGYRSYARHDEHDVCQYDDWLDRRVDLRRCLQGRPLCIHHVGNAGRWTVWFFC